MNGLIACSGNCIDPLTNNQFCGASGDCLGVNAGLTCSGGQTCTGGICCNPGEVNCSGQCVDVSTDINHCGACGNKCAANEQCSSGQCLSHPKPCDSGNFGVLSGANWVVCQADAQTAWVSANNSGTYEINKICIHLGYAKASQWGGTCGNVCGYCQGATSCNNVGSRHFDNSTGCSPPNTHCNTVQWECSQ
jgi:hypothetical protein